MPIPHSQYKVVYLGGIPATDYAVTAQQWEQTLNALHHDGWTVVASLSPGMVLLEGPPHVEPPPPPIGTGGRVPPPDQRS